MKGVLSCDQVFADMSIPFNGRFRDDSWPTAWMRTHGCRSTWNYSRGCT